MSDQELSDQEFGALPPSFPRSFAGIVARPPAFNHLLMLTICGSDVRDDSLSSFIDVDMLDADALVSAVT